LSKSPLRTAAGVTAIFMVLNILLPLNLSPVQTEATEYPFKLKTTLEKTTYKLGELINVTWTLINIGEENSTLYHSRDWFDFVVYDENFIRVFRYASYVLIPGWVVPWTPIPPNGNRTQTRFWKQNYYGSENIVPELWLKKVPPGIYYLTGIFNSLTYNVKPQTPAIRIIITGG